MTWTAPRTWTAGETVTAAMLNTHVRDNLLALDGTWTSFTSTLTGWSVGNGSMSAKYSKTNRKVDFSIVVTFGSESTFAGAPTFSLPFTAVNGDWHAPGYTGRIVDATGLLRPCGCVYASSTTVTVQYQAGSFGAWGDLTPTGPFTWTTGDSIWLTGTFESTT